MSTRANIQVKTADGVYPCQIYKHSDGYPEGVLPALEPFAAQFHEDRGEDAEYFVAAYLRHMGMISNGKAGNLGWGVCTAPHGDEQFYYTVDLTNGGKVIYKS